MDYSIKNITNERDLDRVLAFSEKIFGKSDLQNRNNWLYRLSVHPELMFFIEYFGEIIAAVLGYLEENGNITIGLVATNEQYRKRGIGKKLMFLLEKQAKELDVHMIALGSAETAEGFYTKLGYTGQLLIQSSQYSIEELLTLNHGYPIVFTNVYDGKINQICLKLTQTDRDLQRLYEKTFDDCYTQTMFFKII